VDLSAYLANTFVQNKAYHNDRKTFVVTLAGQITELANLMGELGKKEFWLTGTSPINAFVLTAKKGPLKSMHKRPVFSSTHSKFDLLRRWEELRARVDCER
jgi:hypothetical protein